MEHVYRNIVFVDGYCMVCHWLVLFIAKRDKHDIFRFAAIQDQQAESFEDINPVYFKETSTVILKAADGKVYYHSDAVIRIVSSLSGLWPALKLLLLVPRFIRDPLYKLFARIRYVFGKKNTCIIPKKDITHRIKKGSVN